MLDIEARFNEAQKRAFKVSTDLRQLAWDRALDNVHETLTQLKEAGMMDEPDDFLADWLDEFYEHGCVHLSQEQERIAKLWRR